MNKKLVAQLIRINKALIVLLRYVVDPHFVDNSYAENSLKDMEQNMRELEQDKG